MQKIIAHAVAAKAGGRLHQPGANALQEQVPRGGAPHLVGDRHERRQARQIFPRKVDVLVLRSAFLSDPVHQRT